jgi:hypothetical protein
MPLQIFMKYVETIMEAYSFSEIFQQFIPDGVICIAGSILF